MEFKKIHLNGFKSFAEKTNFLIEEGLTGIVGPNGCGKSNIVESLRWCMGETSAKSMRGSAMEDVIFSGTANKPSKNIAEVIITLENPEKDGPIQFRNIEELKISENHIKEGITNIQSIARLQEIKSGKLKNIVKNNKLFVQAGAGIVADSKPEKEFAETVNKAKALMKAVD